MKTYKVACYVKNALLWKNRDPETMMAYFLDGQYIEHENAAIFPLVTARLFNPDMEGDDLIESTES